MDNKSCIQHQHGRTGSVFTAAWWTLRYALLLLLLLALSACTVLVPDAGEPPATWQPLPTLAPYTTATSQPSPTASPSPQAMTPTVTPTATSLPEVPSTTATPLEPQATMAPDRVDGLLGILRSLPDTARYDDYFSELRQNVQWGIAPANEAVESVMDQARDSGRAVRVWGRIERDVDDYSGARIVVERIEFTSPPPSPSPGETATATATATPEEAPGPTDTPEEVPSPTDTPEALPSPTATSETLPSPTATVATPSPTATPDAQPSPTATLETRPVMTPTPRPQAVVVEGWLGMIRPLPMGSAYDDYFVAFEREGQYGIASTLPPVEEQLALYRDSGAIVRIWGILEYGVDDYGGARIYVTRVEAVD